MFVLYKIIIMISYLALLAVYYYYYYHNKAIVDGMLFIFKKSNKKIFLRDPPF